MLGCNGLKTSCNQFYIRRVLLEYIIVVSARAVTKSRTGTWGLGLGDVRLGDVGRGDSGT